jgi:putative membrane protein
MRRPTRPDGSLIALAGAIGAFLLAPVALEAAGNGHLSRHMLAHILLMGAVAPAAAGAGLRLVATRPRLPFGGAVLPGAAAQAAALWGWHAPPVLAAALASPVLHLLLQASLFATALWFWLGILSVRDHGRWRSILVLLVTAKLFCLLGVLLTFAPRALFLGHAAAAPMHEIADQQLAGLLMLAACPLTYIVAGVLIAARWLKDLGMGPSARSGGPAQPAG